MQKDSTADIVEKLWRLPSILQNYDAMKIELRIFVEQTPNALYVIQSSMLQQIDECAKPIEDNQMNGKTIDKLDNSWIDLKRKKYNVENYLKTLLLENK